MNKKLLFGGCIWVIVVNGLCVVIIGVKIVINVIKIKKIKVIFEVGESVLKCVLFIVKCCVKFWWNIIDFEF